MQAKWHLPVFLLMAIFYGMPCAGQQTLAHRLEIRELAVATRQWPPKGGASRNQVMASEMVVPASFSPLH